MFSLKKPLFLLIGCIFILMCASCAFASDLNQSCNLEDVKNYEINIDVENGILNESGFGNNILEISQPDSYNEYNVTEKFVEVNSSSDVIPASYDDLYQDIKNLRPGDNYDIKKDYTIEDCGRELSKNRIITITADSVIINGNGHTINGNNGNFAVFNVIGNNVTIMNLKIANTRIKNSGNYNKVLSAVEWHGDNGVISNCVFDNNHGDDGGAIYWIGNNGLLDNCYFNDNVANRGGSISMHGNNNTISNSLFKDSYSYYLDSIFFKNPYENENLSKLYLNNCTFEYNNHDVNDFRVEGCCTIIRDNKQVYPVIPPKSYNELREIFVNLKDGDVYTLTNDYYFDYKCYYYPIRANNVTINGNGHKIYGYDVPSASLLWVTGDNVKIANLTLDFDIDYYADGGSFVEWKGNNGVLENSIFVGNYANYGAAIKWEGNDGIIDNCTFSNNTARLSGSSIFICGQNNKISNSLFIDDISMTTNDYIFVDYKNKNLTLENLSFLDTGTLPFIKPLYNIDLNSVVDNNVNSRIGNYTVYNMNYLIYKSIMDGCLINNLTDEISYYSIYYNETGNFIFTIVRNYNNQDVSYTQDYYFTGINNNTFDSIFSKLKNRDYEIRITLAKTTFVSSQSDYSLLEEELYNNNCFSFLNDDLELDKNFMGDTLASSTNALNVVFIQALNIWSYSKLNMDASPYDVLNINGAGSIITNIHYLTDPDEVLGREDKWIQLSENKAFAVSNMTIQGFNTAIENMGGQGLLDYVNFNKNKMDYSIDRDWGAAILNTGLITCINCSFTNNYAKNGGAIFNQGLLTVIDCIFENNIAYGKGDDICVGDGGQVIFNNRTITANEPHVYFAESMSVTTSTIIMVASFGVSFIAGGVVGFLTANPFIGIGVGAAIGAAIGSGSAAWIISQKYDVNFDRMKTLLMLTIESAMAGAVGGCIGGVLGASQLYHENIISRKLSILIE